MTDREMKKLNRAELLELLLEQMDENRRLREELDQAQAALADRRIRLEHAGSIAQAALALNGVFEAADRAAQAYLDSVRHMAEQEQQE